jgi:hypothetical protein
VTSNYGLELSDAELAPLAPSLRLAVGVAAMERHRQVALLGALSSAERVVLAGAIDRLWAVLSAGPEGRDASEAAQRRQALDQLHDRPEQPEEFGRSPDVIGPRSSLILAGLHCWDHVATGDDGAVVFAAGSVLEDVEAWAEFVLDERWPGWTSAPDGRARALAFREVAIEVGQQRIDLADAFWGGTNNPEEFLREARWRAEIVAAERVASFRADRGL